MRFRAVWLALALPLLPTTHAVAPMDPHQHHTGALRMSEVVFDTGQPGVGALAQEIKVMGQWRKACYPEAPAYPVALRSGGDPNTMESLQRMTPAQIEAMRMMGSTTPPTPTRHPGCVVSGGDAPAPRRGSADGP